jgi:ATP-binding cassette subfamily F protein uup
MNYLSVENLSKSYGIKKLFENLSFGISQGQKVALIAKNGTGKSTLLKCILGQESPDTGNVTLRKDIQVGYLGQEDDFDETKTIFDEILKVDNPKIKAIKLYNLALQDENNFQLMSDALEAMEKEHAWDVESKMKEILSKLKLEDMSMAISIMSGGQRKRLALANVLIQEPEMLFLDEPTNHLDLEMIEWLEEYLSRANNTIFMITHDRYFLESICDEILEIYDGDLNRYKGNYSYYLEKKAEREEVDQVNIGKAKSLMSKELVWLRRQPKARGTKSKARIDAFDGIKEKATKRYDTDKVEINVQMERLGTKIIEMHKVTKSYGDLKILDKFDYNFSRRERVGIIGKNGTGKSTMLNMIMGLEALDGGKVVLGETVKLGYYSQKGMQLKKDKKVIEVITDIAEYIPLAKGKKLTATALLEKFLFDKDKQYHYVSTLSGGEKRRLYLLTILITNPNFLILDEPTNDLDIYTLNVLEDYLQEFQGCIAVVTHDRYFMDKLTEHLFVFKGDGEVQDFWGNYSEYLEKEKSLKITPKKIKVEKVAPIKEEVKKVRFGYNEKRELGQLDVELPRLEKKKVEMEASLMDSEIPMDQLTAISEKLGKLISELESKSERWFELTEMSED